MGAKNRKWLLISQIFIKNLIYCIYNGFIYEICPPRLPFYEHNLNIVHDVKADQTSISGFFQGKTAPDYTIRAHGSEERSHPDVHQRRHEPVQGFFPGNAEAIRTTACRYPEVPSGNRQT